MGLLFTILGLAAVLIWYLWERADLRTRRREALARFDERVYVGKGRVTH